MRTLYDVLGVRPSVADATISRAFRKLAKAHHPDLNVGDRRSEQIFKQITAAYATLKNPTTRAAYDTNLKMTRRLTWQRRRRELFACVIAAVASFGVVSASIVHYREVRAGASAGASQDRPAAPQDEQRAVAALVDTVTPDLPVHQGGAPPALDPTVEPPRVEMPEPESQEPAEQATRSVAMAMQIEAARETATPVAASSEPATPVQATDMRVRAAVGVRPQAAPGYVMAAVSMTGESRHAADGSRGACVWRQIHMRFAGSCPRAHIASAHRGDRLNGSPRDAKKIGTHRG
jgi:DnaJ-like protein